MTQAVREYRWLTAGAEIHRALLEERRELRPVVPMGKRRWRRMRHQARKIMLLRFDVRDRAIIEAVQRIDDQIARAMMLPATMLGGGG